MKKKKKKVEENKCLHCPFVNIGMYDLDEFEGIRMNLEF